MKMKLEALILTGLIAGATVLAQEATPPHAPVPTTPGATPPPAPVTVVPPNGANRQGFQRLMQARAMQDLSPEQQAKLTAANESFTKMNAPLEERMLKMRAELESAVTSTNFNEATIRAKAQQLAGVEGDIAVARALRVSKLREFLREDQVQRLNAPQTLMRPSPGFSRTGAGQLPPPQQQLRAGPGPAPGQGTPPPPKPVTQPAPAPAPAPEK